MNMLNWSDALRIWHRYFACCALIMFTALLNLEARAASTASQVEINRLGESADTENSRAIRQLNIIYNSQFSGASPDDKRALLIALISLNLNENQLGNVHKLIAELTQLGTQYHDDWSRVMALNFQATMFTREGLPDQASKAMTEARTLASEMFATDEDHVISDLKTKYETLLHDKQTGTQEQKDYVQSVELNNDQLRRTIYVLSMLVAGSVTLLGYFLYRKLHVMNRMLYEANMKLEVQSTRDPLTGLLNRRAFHDSMKARMKVIDRRFSDINQPPHALALLDIDHFKVINDKFGDAIGDTVLIEVSNRLAQIMRENDKLMRWSGEEFLLFLNNITAENLERVIQRVLSVVGSAPIVVENKPLNVTVSVGYISLAHGKDSDIDENWEKSLKLADAALYKAKINGRNQAVGIPNNTIAFQDLDAMLTINLDDLTHQDKIVVSKITGPLQRDKIIGKFALDS